MTVKRLKRGVPVHTVEICDQCGGSSFFIQSPKTVACQDCDFPYGTVVRGVPDWEPSDSEAGVNK